MSGICETRRRELERQYWAVIDDLIVQYQQALFECCPKGLDASYEMLEKLYQRLLEAV